jgi:hypothetical protein
MLDSCRSGHYRILNPEKHLLDYLVSKISQTNKKPLNSLYTKTVQRLLSFG